MSEADQTANIPGLPSKLTEKQLGRILAATDATLNDALPHWRQAGRVLEVYRQKKRYSEKHDSFKDFCEMLGQPSNRLHMLIGAVQIVAGLKQWAGEDEYVPDQEDKALAFVGLSQRDVREVADVLKGRRRFRWID